MLLNIEEEQDSLKAPIGFRSSTRNSDDIYCRARSAGLDVQVDENLLHRIADY